MDFVLKSSTNIENTINKVRVLKKEDYPSWQYHDHLSFAKFQILLLVFNYLYVFNLSCHFVVSFIIF